MTTTDAVPAVPSDPEAPATAPGRPTRRIAIDRTECRGRGVCATLLAGDVSLDEWGYPVFRTTDVDAQDGEIAVRMCPARALSWAKVLERRAG